jgi:hypothetical protein
MGMIEPSTTFRRTTSQMSCKLNDEIAILDIGQSVYFGLQGAAVQIWDALEQPRSVAYLCDAILAEFDVSPEECRADVAQLLGSLRDAGLIEVATDEA